MRRVALLGQCVGAVKGLLRQHQCRLRALQLRLPRGNGFHPCSDEYVGKLCLGNGHRCSHLFELGDSLRIIDPYEHCLCGDVLATLDGYFLDPSVDTRSDVEPRCIGLTLHEQWFRPQEIEEGKRDDDSCNDADDDRRSTRRGATCSCPACHLVRRTYFEQPRQRSACPCLTPLSS